MSTAVEGATLTQQTLDELEAKGVSVPKYDRSALSSSILHIGVGNFHRAHQADHVDKVLSKEFENNKQWGIIGGSLYAPNRPTAEKRKQLEDQDWMQTIVEQDGESEKAIVIGSMTDFLPVNEDNSSIQKSMMDPNIKIVSLTVTEGGYYLKDGKFDVNDPDVQYDINNMDGTPKTVYGMLVKALKHRRDEGLAPMAVLSCDNLPHNGDVVRSVLLGIASEVDADLAKWIEDNVACPNNMVDRITPRTTDENREHIKEKYGYEDSWPIFCEPFTQWVLEDNFPQGRPQLEILDSVTFVGKSSSCEATRIQLSSFVDLYAHLIEKNIPSFLSSA
jgi:mannitol 2-dehydrogenase